MPIRDVMYGYIFSLYQYIRTTWPISIIYGPDLTTPSKETEDRIKKAIQLLKTNDETNGQVFSLLQGLPQDEDWLSVADVETGYDILQHAVLFRRKEVVIYLVTHGCDPDRYSCGPPIHLAAYLGEVGIVKLLLDLWAKCNLKRGMCYPEPHIPISFETHYFSFTEHPIYLCKTHRLTPIQCAIHSNSLPCVQAILNHNNLPSNGKNDQYTQSLLMHSCREGAPDCIRYFVHNHPEYINSYMDGDTPLLAAVPWGEECANILLKNGADVHLRSEGILETALHRLYRQNIDGLFTIYDTTKYLLTTGLEQEVNAYTHLGETPLHMLVSHISYIGGNFVDPQRKSPRHQLQESYQAQVLAAVRLLLEFNADPHLLNSPGLTPLIRILHISLKAVWREDKCSCVQTSQPNIFINDYRIDYGTTAAAMETLINFGSDPNFKCSLGHTPLILLLQLLLHDDVSNICSQHNHVVKAFKVLLSNGADANFTSGNQGTAYSILALICLRCFQNEYHRDNSRFDPVRNPPLSLRIQFGDVINDVLAALLRYGLNPNPTTTKISQHLQGGCGNGLNEFVRLASHAATIQDFDLMEKWIQTLLQWGADPDLEPYPAEPIICHCQSSIFLKKLGTQPLAHYIHEVKDRESLRSNPSVQRILLLFYHSMSEHILRECLSTVRVGVHIPLMEITSATFGPFSSVSVICNGNVDLQSVMTIMCERPRSLKELSRLSIYKSLNRELALRVNCLPLPLVVKNYLLEIG